MKKKWGGRITNKSEDLKINIECDLPRCVYTNHVFP